MKIGLIDVDGHHFPNLALMKLANYYKKNGDTVEWYNGLEWYDKVYMSKVFTFTPDDYRVIQASQVIKGGTGYGMYDELFCDKIQPDYSLYPVSDWYDKKTAYGLLTRGCIRNCNFCVVPRKEGSIRPYMDIEEVLQHYKKAILLDNNILASDYGLEQIEKIIKLGCRIDFNQGLDCRLVTRDIAKLLSKVKWLRYIRFSCDHISCLESVKKALLHLNAYGIKNSKIFVYVLVRDINEAEFICNTLKYLGCTPFAQPFRSIDNKIEITQEQKVFAWWVNHVPTFKSCNFQEYKAHYIK